MVALVTVVGGGVIGLTSALGLAQAGHTVRCVRDEPVAATTSAVAGGLWFPYHVEPRDRVLAWGRVALERFTDLARDPDAGVVLREGVVVERGPADRWWAAALPTWREARAGELPAGAPAGVVASVPLVTMPVFLPWLETRCREAGVELVHGWVSDLAEVPGDVVVVAAGLRSGTLVDDHAGTPSRGQVALLANPGLTHWLVDDEHPDGMVYVLPHPQWVVCGGTDVAGSWDAVPDRDGPRRDRAPGAVGGARAGARRGAGRQGGAAAGGARGAARGIRGRWATGRHLLRPRRRGRHPVVGVRRRGGPPRRRGHRLTGSQASDAGRERPAFVSPRRFLAESRRSFDPRVGRVARRGAGGGAIASRSRSAIRSRAATRLRRCWRCSDAATTSSRPPTSRESSARSTRARWVSVNPPKATTSSSTSTRLSAVLTP